ncbi:hypothetical protein NJC38_15610 [Pseudomonas sp. 21LCFQ010]|uniref:toxin VasX n=1 Tax=Pseudomonas sp. 21LCFQ010 TaxID=2957506 RepID=UPI002096A51D|nr:toxin VasX [Pseudomonas sp. 21LCFQ010]MCO8163585.1 hypothetical protein [Pseudomonas sp. 21LCFQ010]
MTDKSSSSALLNLSQAERAAGQRPRQDIDSLVATCPASQGKLFVVPTRYALAEYPADHASCQPGVEPQSHPMAVRRLREGFLYLWQSPGPLQRFAICPQGMLEPQPLTDDDTITLNGSLTGLALDKHSPAWLMYAEYPLNARSCEALNDPGTRQKRMRRLDLPQVANHLSAAHCPPLEAAEQVIAELMPQTYHWGVVSDHQLNGDAEYKKAEQLKEQMFANPTAETSKAWTDAMYWVGERDRIASKHAEAPQGRPAPGQWSAAAWQPLHTRKWLDSARQEAAECWAVFACLDDDLGVLRDIDRDQSQFEDAHQQWVSDNQIRLTVGGFIRSLMTEDGAELANLINYRFKEEKLKITPEQGNTLLKIHERLDPLRFEESRLANASAVLITPEGKQKLASLKEEISLLKKPVNNFIPVKLQKDVEIETRVYRQHKTHNQRSGKFSGKIGEYIDLSTMNNWLDVTAPDHYKSVEVHHRRLHADRDIFLYRHESGTWFVDYDDINYRNWLDQLAAACLSEQCNYSQGAEQFAEYVRSQDKGALRQLFFSWSPSLEMALNSETRLGEVLVALGDENRSNIQAGLSGILGASTRSILTFMQRTESNSRWVTLVNRMAPTVMLLKGELDRISRVWMSLMIFTHIKTQIAFRWVTNKNFRTLEAFGKNVDELKDWTKLTSDHIKSGRAAQIINSRAVKSSGGVTALIVLTLNIWNASRYLNQANAVERMDEQRNYETASATLYASAALVAVIDSVIRKGFGINQLKIGLSFTATQTFFSSIIGALSIGAAVNEFQSLKKQIDSSNYIVDPWLEARKNIVSLQILAFTAQTLIASRYTIAILAGTMTIGAGLAGAGAAIAPLLVIIAILGGAYLITWLFQQTPLQNFLYQCCWSIQRAKERSPLDHGTQQKELEHLLALVYTPRINYESISSHVPTDGQFPMRNKPHLQSLSIDLPGATPDGVYLELAMIGDPVDYRLWMDIWGTPGLTEPPYRMRDMGSHWLKTAHYKWIPANEGQGLRLTGRYLTDTVMGSLPRSISIKIKYSTPITSLLGINHSIGGDSGLIYTITAEDGVISLRPHEAPTLSKARLHRIGVQRRSLPLH